MTAAPYIFTFSAYSLNFSSPSFSEIEFTTLFPCVHLSPASITDHLDESITIGSFAISGSAPTRFRNLVIDASESSIPSSIFTSIICAPPSTWCLATESASSKSSSLISLRNFAEPVTFVLSPIFVKLLPLYIVNGSNPLNLGSLSITGGFLGGYFLAISAIAFMCSGVVPQHPPTIFTSPSCKNSSML